MTLKKTLALLAAASTSFAMVACSDSSSSSNSAGSSSNADGNSSAASGDGNYVLVNGSEPQNPLIPANTNETGGGRIIDHIYSGLVYYDGEGAAHYEVAESIEANDTNTEFTVKLKDWKFSDGSPVTANSFVDAWNYAVANAQLGSYFFEPIKGYAEEGVDKLEGLEVIDDKTFKITLDSPAADFPDRLGYSAYFPLPESAFDDMDGFGAKPVSNGPYILQEWGHNQHALLVPNPEYDGPRAAQNEGVDIVFYPTQDAAYADLLSGNLDVLDAIPDSAFSVFESDLGDRAVNQPAAVFQSFTIPESLDHFSGEEGKLRRQAISHAIDRKEITDTIFEGTRTPASDFSSPVVPGWSADVPGNEVLEFDPAKAKELWAQADAISEWSTPKFEIAYNSDGGHQAWVDAVTNQLRNNLGIDAVGAPYPDFKSLRDEVTNRTITTAFRTGWQADYPGMGNFLAALYGTGAGSNDGDYSNPEFDAKIREADAADTSEDATAKFVEAQTILFEDLPAIPTWYSNVVGGYSENVDNVTFSWKSQPVLNEITKK
ncbi:MAG: ABC transporter substrate-binding protein [Corynebacterium sp.]|nr:ABC transporter substrate-binding protein [Corynebacterium sp.]